MTTIELTLRAGRMLDASVAERMGWKNCDPFKESEAWPYAFFPNPNIEMGVGELPESKPGCRMRGVFPKYSTEIEPAWEVWKRVRVWSDHRHGYWAEFIKALRHAVAERLGLSVMATTDYMLYCLLPVDICRAYLRVAIAIEESTNEMDTQDEG